MEQQNYAKHARFVPMYHYVLAGLVVLTLIGSVVNFFRHIGDGSGRIAVTLPVFISLAMVLQFFFSRVFPPKAQDRAIRAEENLRHFALTGKLLDQRLKMSQIIALRFASDGEFVELARKAAAEGLLMDAIKKSIKNWRADHDRL